MELKSPLSPVSSTPTQQGHHDGQPKKPLSPQHTRQLVTLGPLGLRNSGSEWLPGISTPGSPFPGPSSVRERKFFLSLTSGEHPYRTFLLKNIIIVTETLMRGSEGRK